MRSRLGEPAESPTSRDTGLIRRGKTPCLRRSSPSLRGAAPMFIKTEQTPNPATLKFLPGCTVVESGTANFPDRGSAARSPLAERLFQLPEITGVFLAT